MTKFLGRIAQHQWRDAANLILGLWLALSPTILSYIQDDAAALNATVMGIAIAVMAAAALMTFHKWEEWINVALAAWLIVSPFMLHYVAHSEALWNQIITGVVVGGLALWTAATEHEGDATAR